MKYYILSSSHVGVSYDGNTPPGAIECPKSVYDNASGYSVVGNKLIAPTADELSKISENNNIQENTYKRDSLLSLAMSTISLWQSEASLGIISDEDKKKLTNWISYIKLLKCVDVKSTSPEWPTQPEI